MIEAAGRWPFDVKRWGGQVHDEGAFMVQAVKTELPEFDLPMGCAPCVITQS